MHEIEYKPNPKPAANRYIKAFTVSSVNALGQIIQTAYDGLGRPVLVKDPNGVRLSFAWDGLSRKVERRISNPEGVSPAVVSHFSTQRDDLLCQTTVRNELTGLVTITKHDFIHRPISKITSDETLTYVYDEGGTNAKNHLVSVISSKGIDHHFDYDARGSVIASKLSIDDHIFLTRHEWTPSKKLRRSLNPDGSTVTTTYFTDSNVAHKVDLANPDGISRASLVFSNFDGPSSRPLFCELGNGLQSTVSLAENGAPTSMVLSRGQASVYQQIWELDGFGRIGSYINKPEDSFRALNNSFSYDAGGASGSKYC
jgi:YD repeat-containing protein